MGLYARHPTDGIEDGAPGRLFVSAQRSVVEPRCYKCSTFVA
jgi:hypothetical protein